MDGFKRLSRNNKKSVIKLYETLVQGIWDERNVVSKEEFIKSKTIQRIRLNKMYKLLK